MPRRRRFVISPIGQVDSTVREHADDVFDFIIKPAMAECKVEAYRSDHLREHGRITDQMFSAILQEDLCIALLTGYNPNVFYELAIAQAAGKPEVGGALVLRIPKSGDIFGTWMTTSVLQAPHVAAGLLRLRRGCQQRVQE
jgi:hypothetical protein